MHPPLRRPLRSRHAILGLSHAEATVRVWSRGRNQFPESRSGTVSNTGAVAPATSLHPSSKVAHERIFRPLRSAPVDTAGQTTEECSRCRRICSTRTGEPTFAACCLFAAGSHTSGNSKAPKGSWPRRSGDISGAGESDAGNSPRRIAPHLPGLLGSVANWTLPAGRSKRTGIRRRVLITSCRNPSSCWRKKLALRRPGQAAVP